MNPGPTVQPYNSYRFNAMRWDSSSGQYDMGFRNYDPGLNQFLTRDMYDGALANMGLTADPFTGSPYAFGQGNPISNIELDGHMPCIAGGPCGSIQYLEHWSASQPATPATSTGPSNPTGGTTSPSLPGCNSVVSRLTGPCTVVQPGAAPSTPPNSPGAATPTSPSLPGCNSVVSRLTGQCTVEMPKNTATRAPDYYTAGGMMCIIICWGQGVVKDRYGQVYHTYQFGIGCCFVGGSVSPGIVLEGGSKPPSASALKNLIIGLSGNAGLTAGPASVNAQWMNPVKTNGPNVFSVEPGGGGGIGFGGWIGGSWTTTGGWGGTPPPGTCGSPVESRYDGCQIQQ
jgi:RHS repeat-associated protein